MNNIEALHKRAVTHHQAGRLEEALGSYDELLALAPGHAGALYDRATLLWGMGRLSEALATTDRALAANPRYVEAWYNRGVMLQHLGRPEEALESFNAAVTMRPDFAAAFNNRGVALKDMMRWQEALASFDAALRINPDLAGVHNNRGAVLLHLKRFEVALDSFDAALHVNPRHDDAHFNRGTTLQNLGRTDEAQESFRKTLECDPDHPDAFGSIAGNVIHLCDWRQYADLAEGVRTRISGGKSIIQPGTVMTYTDDPVLQRRSAEIYMRSQVPAQLPVLPKVGCYGHERIRIAYLSSDFYEHPVAYQLAELIERHDRARFEVTGISTGLDDNGPTRARLVKAFDSFHDIRLRSDTEAAALIREIETDILVDLNGHTEGSRPAILARRPAPVQALYLGYAGTSGADFIDYVLADQIVVPRAHQAFFTEKIVQLPDCFMATDATRTIGATPSRTAEGLPEDGFVFCAFNNHWKITPSMFDLWMRLLNSVAGSVLWLRGGNEKLKANLRREAAARGVDPDRLVFAARAEIGIHLARHRLADLFLDNFPYNAHSTACDALWAGLPLVTCCGNTFGARVAASLLHAVGLPELVTQSPEHYEVLALELARDPALLRSFRSRLGENRGIFPLFDGERFRRGIEAAYTHMWRIAERGQAPRSFSAGDIA